jgi:hypothetical protein
MQYKLQSCHLESNTDYRDHSEILAQHYALNSTPKSSYLAINQSWICNLLSDIAIFICICNLCICVRFSADD